MGNPVFTIGHSNHELSLFLDLLMQHRIEIVVDVRSSPYSQWVPQFGRELLSSSLRKHGIEYKFLGRELGARSTDPDCYANGRADYARIAATQTFRDGIAQLLLLSQRFRVALMCSEAEPLDCHRSILLSRELAVRGVSVIHILRDGNAETHEAAMSRLREILRLPERDLFLSEQELLENAYERQGQRIAYTKKFEPA